jgi:hypothetical protein
MTREPRANSSPHKQRHQSKAGGTAREPSGAYKELQQSNIAGTAREQRAKALIVINDWVIAHERASQN